MRFHRTMLITGLSTLFGLLFLAALLWVSASPMWGMYRRTGSRQVSPVTIGQARGFAEDYLKSFGDADLAIDEIMEFELNFYIVYYEKSTGIGAFEAVIDKADAGGMMTRMMDFGYVRLEQGPNMMWNTKYGMHSMMDRWKTPLSPTVTEGKAKEIAQKYLDADFPGKVAEDVHSFYGYYTIHVIKDNRIYCMLSVNSHTGQVWYHNWHGSYIQTLEMTG